MTTPGIELKPKKISKRHRRKRNGSTALLELGLPNQLSTQRYFYFSFLVESEVSLFNGFYRAYIFGIRLLDSNSKLKNN